MRAERWVLAVAMLLPLATTFFYFVVLSGGTTAEPSSNPFFQTAYYGGKIIQFGLPIVWMVATNRAALRIGRLTWRGVPAGVAFGTAIAVFIFALYYGWLAGSPLFDGVGGRIHSKLSEFGAGTPSSFLALASFLCVVHSLFEEFYWRWFVYGRLRRHVPLTVSTILSALAFMAHHVVVLWVFFPNHVWAAVLPFSLGIAVGGIVWAWLYERTGSLIGPWSSHLIVDAALMTVGYELVFGG